MAMMWCPYLLGTLKVCLQCQIFVVSCLRRLCGIGVRLLICTPITSATHATSLEEISRFLAGHQQFAGPTPLSL
ncbi:hypothetical protein [Comamonas kerstersii]|uniref:hypothetical protein n=1 Tax=Comamonas kerstersii TaxID=225992 RepID=UPI0019645851|nr:hypothetical protein [Comamonas kerstersii]